MKKTVLLISYFLIWVIVLQLVSFIIGQASATDINTWYPNLVKSSLTPPDIAFPIVWPILYFLLAIVGAILFQTKRHFSPKIKAIYLIQLILNWMWSPIFFNLHEIGLALILLIAMVILTATLTTRLWRQHMKLSILLVPYLLWISFATYLNAVIWFNL